MKESYNEKVYEFSKVLRNHNEWLGNIQIVQIGETCLDKSACIETHVQTCNEITLILSGNGVLISDKTEIDCSPGDIHVISKGVYHKIIANKETPLRYIHFAFDFDGYEPEDLASFYGQCKSIVMHDTMNLKSILGMLVNEYYNDSQYAGIVRNSLVQLILVLIWRKVHLSGGRYRPETNDNLIGSTIYNVIKYIDEHVCEKVTVSSIADEFSYSVSYISHLFKAKTGVSLKEYIIAKRMDYATLLLAEGNLSFSEIASQTGYESVQSFCKRYKHHTGKTPGDIRKNTSGGLL